MLRELRPALIVFGALTLVTGVAYPGVVTLVAQDRCAARSNIWDPARPSRQAQTSPGYPHLPVETP